MKIKIITAGKLKGSFYEPFKKYIKRSNRFANVELKEFKDNKDFEDKILKESAKTKSLLILLDESGKELSSKEFAKFLDKRESLGKSIVFAIGPADGFSDTIKLSADHILSLSKLTLAHDIAALVFAEALYRALSIRAGHPYHRG